MENQDWMISVYFYNESTIFVRCYLDSGSNEGLSNLWGLFCLGVTISVVLKLDRTLWPLDSPVNVSSGSCIELACHVGCLYLRSVLNFMEFALVGHFRIKGFVYKLTSHLHIIHIQICRILTNAQELYSFPMDLIILDGWSCIIACRKAVLWHCWNVE